MKIYQLIADGEDCIGSSFRMYSQRVFTSRKKAEEYKSLWRLIITASKDKDGNPYLRYLTSIHSITIHMLELEEEQ